MGVKGRLQISGSEARFGLPPSRISYSGGDLLGVTGQVVDALDSGFGSGLDLPPQLLFVKDVSASKLDLRKAVVNFIGGRADAEAYQAIFDKIDATSANDRLLNVTYAYAQSDARATFAALKTSYGAITERAYQANVQNFEQQLEIMQKAPWYLRGFLAEGVNSAGVGIGAAAMVRSTALDISYATDSLAPSRLRSDARRSLFIDAALTFGSLAVGGAIRATKAVTTFARLNRFRSADEVADVLTSLGRRRDELAELNASRRLAEMEAANPGAHFVSRHGAQTTIEQQHIRATTGMTPDGKALKPINASRFNSNRSQLAAAQRADTIYRQTGRAEFDFDMGYSIGEGFTKHGTDLVRTNVTAVFRNGKTVHALSQTRADPMKYVNIYFVTALLSPLTGGGDDEDEVNRYRGLDPEDEQQMRAVIVERLRPYFLRFDPKSKEIAKHSLQYFLCDAKTDFGRIFDSCVPPLDPPSEPRRFFEWLWNELFGNEDFRVATESEYQVHNDINAPNLIQLSER